MSTVLALTMFGAVYLAVGYVIGVPAAALLDLWTDSNNSGRMPIRSILITLAPGSLGIRRYRPVGVS